MVALDSPGRWSFHHVRQTATAMGALAGTKTIVITDISSLPQVYWTLHIYSTSYSNFSTDDLSVSRANQDGQHFTLERPWSQIVSLPAFQFILRSFSGLTHIPLSSCHLLKSLHHPCLPKWEQHESSLLASQMLTVISWFPTEGTVPLCLEKIFLLLRGKRLSFYQAYISWYPSNHPGWTLPTSSRPYSP